MKPEVLLYTALDEGVMRTLEEACAPRFIDMHDPDFDRKALPVLERAVGIIGDGLSVDAAMVAAAPALRIVSNISVGYDNLDMDALRQRGILATNTPDVLTETTADLVFSLILATARKIPQLDRFVKEGRWTEAIPQDLMGTDVHHKTLGIIGMGKIGSAIAQRAALGFDMHVLYHNRSRDEAAEKAYGAEYRELDDLLKTADYICLMTPLTPETENLIGAREFELMKPSAIFINGSRGRTVDEAAMIQALKDRKIQSAGLDVFRQEPIAPDNGLLALDHVVTLPHMGSNTVENTLAMQELAVHNLLCALRGERPPNLINDMK